jgi:N-acetylglucosaminyl-diphospho-decaprenol L-rhamnosyltransferase
MEPVDVTAIVVTWNRPELLRRCLETLPAAGREARVSVEVIVVDNGSTAGDAEMVAREFPAVQVIRSDTNLGFARANNLALERASGRYLLLVNNDVRLPPGAIEGLCGYLECHADVGIVGPRLVLPDGTEQRSRSSFLTPGRALLQALHGGWIAARLTARKQGGQAADPAATDWVSGACFLIRREVADQVGPLDPDYFFYAEEMDWCFRARRQGWRVHHVPGVSVWHDHAATARSNPRWYERMLHQGRFLFLQKHYGGLAAAAFRAATLVGSVPLLLRWRLSRGAGAEARREEARERLAWALRPGAAPMPGASEARPVGRDPGGEGAER